MKKEKEKYVVALKGPVVHGKIRPGKVLGKFREEKFAKHALPGLAASKAKGHHESRVGIFHNDCLVG